VKHDRWKCGNCVHAEIFSWDAGDVFKCGQFNHHVPADRWGCAWFGMSPQEVQFKKPKPGWHFNRQDDCLEWRV
jgi:hypothetical protein